MRNGLKKIEYNPSISTSFQNCGIILDSTSLEIPRPKLSFSEAKAFWDGKNHFYSLKKEVAILNQPPYYALPPQNFFIGSKHDFTFFQENCQYYLKYLKKTPSQKAKVASDRQFYFFAILCDKGYIGETPEYPQLRRITPYKGNLNFIERRFNSDLSKHRIHIEQFFGRLKKSFGIFFRPYKYLFIISKK